jgi:hypothetical protein
VRIKSERDGAVKLANAASRITDCEGSAMTTESNIRAALECHWAASDTNDFDAEHQIYRQVLEYRNRRQCHSARFLRAVRGCSSLVNMNRHSSEHEALFMALYKRSSVSGAFFSAHAES